MSGRKFTCLGWAAACFVLACGGDRNAGGSDSGSGAEGAVARAVHAVQVGAFADIGAAQRLSDSLSMAGWQSYVSQGGELSAYRVRVSPSFTPVLAERVAFALRGTGMDATAITDTIKHEPNVEAVRVNSGPHGMSSRVRWLISPNGRSLLIVHDPVGVEAEAVANGFVFASERGGFVLQRDSVWSVAPSPTWAKLAYGQAFSLRGTESDSIPDDAWAAVATASGMPLDSVRAHAFQISGMATVFSYSRPVVVHLDQRDTTLAPGDSTPLIQSLPVSGGWRVQWTADGTLLAMGDAPLRVQDDSPPRNWLSVQIDSAIVRGTISSTRLAPLDWRLGPTLDASIPINMKASNELRLEGASIVSSDGWIRRDGKIVGPGVALAATRDGRFIAALAPRSDAREHENPIEPVLYKVGR